MPSQDSTATAPAKSAPAAGAFSHREPPRKISAPCCPPKPFHSPTAVSTTNGDSSKQNSPTDPSPTALAPRRFHPAHSTTTASAHHIPREPAVHAGSSLPRYVTKITV